MWKASHFVDGVDETGRSRGQRLDCAGVAVPCSPVQRSPAVLEAEKNRNQGH